MGFNQEILLHLKVDELDDMDDEYKGMFQCFTIRIIKFMAIKTALLQDYTTRNLTWFLIWRIIKESNSPP